MLQQIYLINDLKTNNNQDLIAIFQVYLILIIFSLDF